MSIDGEMGLHLVDHGLDAFVEHALGIEDELDGVAAGAAAAGVRRDVMRFGLHLRARIGHRHRESALAHHGKIDHVVADVSDLVERHAFLLHDFAHRLHLERLALVDEFELEIARAGGHGLTDALGDHAALQAADARQRNAGAVVGAVALGFHHGGGLHAEADLAVIAGELLVRNRGVRRRGRRGDQPDGAVGEDSVHVEHDDLDAAGAFVRGQCHASILDARHAGYGH